MIKCTQNTFGGNAMKILIIRHGDPDYSIDSLTEKGKHEAQLLKDRLTKLDIRDFYCSPLGRAKDTAAPTLNALGRTAEICDWLREFDGRITDPKTGEKRVAWDRLPSSLYGENDYYDRSKWLDTELYTGGDVKEKYDEVCRGLDELLARYGYIHDKNIFRVEKECTDTIALFCHFGVECVLLSHLLYSTPVTFWQGFVALPSSVTTLATEEREHGIAHFRCSGFGDLSHLYAGGEPPAFAARFCEVYSNFDERH